ELFVVPLASFAERYRLDRPQRLRVRSDSTVAFTRQRGDICGALQSKRKLEGSMSNYPVKIKRRAVKPSGEPKSAMMAAPESRSGHGTFRYAYASLSFAGDGQKAHLNARRVEWNGDKLETESFE